MVENCVACAQGTCCASHLLVGLNLCIQMVRLYDYTINFSLQFMHPCDAGRNELQWLNFTSSQNELI